MTKPYLIVVGGPTASGKTSLSIELAQHFDAEIISCDSRQFFREMNIGTAKPSKEELAAAKHHFINNKSIHDGYSVGDYERDALTFLEGYFKEKNIAILVGGSGLYIKALCEGLDEFPRVDAKAKRMVIDLYEKGGIESLQQMLQEQELNH